MAEARKAAGLTQERLGELAEVERTTISDWERGESTPYPQQRAKLAEALTVTLTELDAMLSFVANPTDRTPVWLSQFLGSEQSAIAIAAHEPHVVHGLLQTPAYAAAIGRSVGVAGSSEEYAQRNVEQREYRQARVKSGGLTLHVVQSEMPLRLKMGNAALMADQMARLVELGAQPNVTLQIVPFDVGQYEALRIGTIDVMTHHWVRGFTIYHVAYPRMMLIEDVNEAANYQAAVENAATVALSPDDSSAFIREAEKRWRQADD